MKKVDEVLSFLRDYSLLIYLSALTIFIINDYYVFTEVFGLHQSLFLNYALLEIVKEQWLIVFILLPITIGLLIAFLFKYQVDTLKEIDGKHLATNNNWLLLIFLLDILLGDILIFKILEFIVDYLKIYSLLLFSSVLYLLYFFLNICSYTWILNIINVNLIFNFNLGKLGKLKKFYSALFLFVILKILIYTLFFSFLKLFKFFIYINLIWFSGAALFISVKRYKASDSTDQKEIKFSIKERYAFIFITMIGMLLFLYNTDQILRMPYENRSFWANSVYVNDITKSNFSVLFNPLKISIDPLISNQKAKDLAKYLKKRHLKKIQFELTNRSVNIFYLPIGEYKIVFLVPKNILKDAKYVIVLFTDREYKTFFDIGKIHLQ